MAELKATEAAKRLAGPIAPLTAADVSRWDVKSEVVVVGLGAAGACAAIEAAETGAQVLAIEAAASGGGTSAMSGGLIYLGGGTPIQEACGYRDTPQDMERFLLAACGPGADEEKVHAYCHGSVEHYRWLVDHGVPFEGTFHATHDREPPDTSGLQFTGGEDSWPFTEIAPPVPRGHHPAHPGAAGGFLMQRLLAAVERAEVPVVANATVGRLVVDGANVIGVEATIDTEPTMIRAARGVVLTAGGFMQNREMVERNCPVALRCTVPLGTVHDDGRGIRMAAGVGAAMVGMDRVEVGMALTPPRSLVRGVFVNARGERFMNEDTYSGRLGQEFLLRQEGKVYWVHSDETFAVNLVGYQPTWVGDSAAEIEAAIGLPTGSLQTTLATYNEHAAQGEDPLFRKADEWVIPLEPPYGVVDLTVERSIYAPFTLGGLATTVDGQVLATDGSAIQGLFAAGRTTAGIAAGGYVSGISLGDSTFFGRRAGRRAATEAS